MANTQNRNVNIYYNNKVLGKTPAELRKQYYKLNNEIKHMDTNSRAYQKTARQMSQIDAKLKKHYQEVRGVNRAWQQTKSVMLGAVGAASGLMIFQRVMSFIPDMIRRNADLSDSYAQVMKTTGMTRVEVQDLDSELRKLDTRTPRKQLLELAYTAGKLGNQGRQDIKDFVEAADIINVSLGEDLGEGAILQIGKIASIFGLKDQYGIKEGMLKVASAINEIGMSSEAAENFLVDFTKRMSGVSGIAKLTVTDNLALAGTLDALGQRAETSSTALSKTFIKMGSDTAEFARIADMELNEFSELLNTDIMAALIAVLKGVKNSSSGIEDLSRVLGDLGVDGGRIVGVLGTLANNTEELGRQLKIAEKGFDENTSAMQEFEVRNTTFGAVLEKTGKKLAGIFTNSRIMNGAKVIVEAFNDMITPELSEDLEDKRMRLRRLEFQLYDTNTPADKRLKLIKDLKKEYPDLLKYIDEDKISNRDLQKELNKVNETLLLRIRVQRRVEEAEDKYEMAEMYGQRVAAIQDNIEEIMIEIGEKSGTFGIQLNPDAGGIEDQIKDMLQQFKDKESEIQDVFSGPASEWTKEAARDILSLRGDLEDQYSAMLGWQDIVNGFLEEEKELREDIERLKGQDKSHLHVTTTYDGSKLPDYKTFLQELEKAKNKGLDKLTDEEKKKIRELHAKALEMYQQLARDVGAASDSVFFAALPEEDQMLIEMNARYDKLRKQAEEALQANQQDTSIDDDARVKREQEILDKIKEINETHDAEMQAFYDQKDKEFLDRKQQLEDDLYMEQQSDEDREIVSLLQHFDEMAVALEAHGLDTEKLTEAIEAKIFAIKKKYRDKNDKEDQDSWTARKARIAQTATDTALLLDGYGQAIQGFSDLSRSIMRDEAEDQKRHTSYMIALQTAVAVANGVAKAMQASSPYEAIAIALGIAGTVASAMAQANELNRDNPVPQYFTGSTSTRSGRALVGEEGAEMIDLPAGARISTASRSAEMSNWYAKPARTFNTDNYTSSLGRSSTASAGLGQQSSAQSVIDTSDLLAEMKAMNKKLDAFKESDKEVRFYQTEYDRFQERRNAVKFVGTLKK